MGYEPQKTSARIFMFCVLAMNIVILKNFSSALTSLLAVKISPIEFNTFQDVVQEQEYQFILEADTAITGAIQVIIKLNISS